MINYSFLSLKEFYYPLNTYKKKYLQKFSFKKTAEISKI